MRKPGALGPFRADQLRSGDPYELSNGYLVPCLPASSRSGKATSVGNGVLASDPAVQDVGVDTGFSPSPETLRAPDLAVGEISDEPGWVKGAPLLAVEYVDSGRDEEDLQIKIQELLAAGTRLFWVVRLTGPLVEILQPGQKTRIAYPGEQLEAPGVLANPVPVEALYDRDAARPVIFRNLLERQGYASLDEVRAEGRTEGEIQTLRETILAVLASRGFTIEEDLRAALSSSGDPAVLRSVLRQAVAASSVAEVFAALRV